jgi:FlaA1/EpsC-like NDP-sugar epimerase
VKFLNYARLLSFTAFVFDLCAVVGSWGAAYVLRFNGMVPHEFAHHAMWALLWLVPLYGVMFRIFGLYRGMWVFASLPDLMRIAKAVAVGAAAMMIVVVLSSSSQVIPRSVLVASPILLFMVMGGARALYRVTKESRRYGGLIAKGQPVIVIGAGQAGANLVRELLRSAEWRLVGLLDDDAAKHGREIHGYPVLGALADLGAYSAKLKVQSAIIAMPTAAPEVQRRAVSICMAAGVKAMILPALSALSDNQASLARVRRIDLEDVLGRDAIVIDTEPVEALLKQRVAMVTGAGGSIGSELCRQILRFGPARLVVLDISEFAIYRLTEELGSKHPGLALIPFIGDVKDQMLLDGIMQRYTPDIVFHAAAYKHVPLMEELNTWQAVRNNVLGTYEVAQAAIRAKVKHFVFISSDKAVNPTNVMGATKRLAEMVCQALQQSSEHTQFETVRFGNVLGSAGSVIPKFQEQIAKGGPITVTHPEITRFFMTIPEAAQLVLQASSMGRGGEIFILDMGKPVRIVDLARDLIHLYGHNEDQIKIVYSGLRPGEKLYEELLADDETTRPTHHHKLRVAQARGASDDLLEHLMPWLLQPRIPEDVEVRAELQNRVPEYTPAFGSDHNSNASIEALIPNAP